LVEVASFEVDLGKGDLRNGGGPSALTARRHFLEHPIENPRVVPTSGRQSSHRYLHHFNSTSPFE